MSGSRTSRRLLAVLSLMLLARVGSAAECLSPGSPCDGPGTSVSGPITTNTTWTLAGSPFVITGNVFVQAGVTLTIEAGVCVKAQSQLGINVDGQLIAQGTSAAPICFTTAVLPPSPGDWAGILFSNTAVDAVFDGMGNYVSGSILEHVVLEGAGYARPPLQAASSAPFIHRNTIRQNSTFMDVPVIQLGGTDVRFVENVVTDNPYFGAGGPLTVGGTNCRIERNRFSSNGQASPNGRDLSIGGTGHVVKDNFFLGDRSTGIGMSGSSNVIVDNVFTSTIDGIVGSGSVPPGIVVRGNLIQGAGSGATIGGFTSFTGNLLRQNVSFGRILEAGNTPTLSGNVLIDNTCGPNFAAVFLSGNADFTGNEVVGNACVGVENRQTHALTGNALDGNAGFDLFNNTASSLDASGGWWGTANAGDIQSQIFDCVDDISKGCVTFAPFDSARGQNIAVSPPSLDFGMVPVGSSADLSLTVDNTGSETLTIHNAVRDNIDFSVVGPALPQTIAPGGTLPGGLTVRCAPLEAGGSVGTLYVLSDDPDSPATAVPLTCNTVTTTTAPTTTSSTSSTTTSSTTSSTTTTLPPADHFKCYAARTRPGTLAVGPQTVTLEDQFETKQTVVLKPQLLCNPVDKNGEGITDPTAHLRCYRIKDLSGQAKFQRRDVTVQNQLGNETATVTKPRLLCVPSRTDGSPATPNGDHFKCYRAKSAFSQQTVLLADEFESKTTIVGKGDTLCNPVDKNGEGVDNPAGHLRCYAIKDVKGQARFERRDVTVSNQFGVEEVSVTRAKLLCVPSAKQP